MCGFAGFITSDISVLNRAHAEAERMALAIQHRGPDDAGVWADTKDGIALGFRRLSILDLSSAGHQPMLSKSGRFVMSFNGEIYNYLELKNTLLKEEYIFNSNSDTEVLLVSYIHWGEKCIHKFNGMWAFAIYDKSNDKLFCSRDRFGVKPFNYSFFKDTFIFSSEIKFIISYFPELNNPNYNVIANYCRTGVGAQLKETWFHNVYRLEPAHNLIIQNNEITLKKYWDYPKKTNLEISFNDAIIEYKKIFDDAIKLRMRSDVPVGFTLSSGIDSSSLV